MIGYIDLDCVGCMDDMESPSSYSFQMSLETFT